MEMKIIINLLNFISKNPLYQRVSLEQDVPLQNMMSKSSPIRYLHHSLGKTHPRNELISRPQSLRTYEIFH